MGSLSLWKPKVWLTEGMKHNRSKPVAGVSAPAVRPTPLGAALLAAAIALPAGLLLQLIDLLWF